MKKYEIDISVKEAIISRRSVRQFLPDPIPDEVIKDILEISSRAPSGTNIQPWNVHVLTGKFKDKVCSKASESFMDLSLIHI